MILFVFYNCWLLVFSPKIQSDFPFLIDNSIKNQVEDAFCNWQLFTKTQSFIFKTNIRNKNASEIVMDFWYHHFNENHVCKLQFNVEFNHVFCYLQFRNKM